MRDRTPQDAGYFLDEYDGPRFWDHVDFHGGTPYLNDPLSRLGSDAGECWVWHGWMGGGGYGRFHHFSKPVVAHRVGYREFNNRLSDDLHLDHLCRNPRCVRHDHLEPVTARENVARGLRGRANRTHCPRGHEYSDSNTRWVRQGKYEARICKACMKARKQMEYQRSKLKSA